MIIGIDIDDTIADYTGQLIRLLRERFGVRITREEWTHFHLEDAPPYAHLRPQFWACMSALMNEGIIATLDPYPGAFDALRRLSEMHQIVFITSRGSRRGDMHLAKRHTLAWLGKHGIAFQGLHFAADGTKPVVAKECGVNLFVEDSGQIARAVADLGIRVLLMDQPHNKDVQHPLITRVASWKEIEAQIEARAAMLQGRKPA